MILSLSVQALILTGNFNICLTLISFVHVKSFVIFCESP